MTNVVEQVGGQTATWTMDPTHSNIGFAVRHMMFTTARGSFGKFDIGLNFDESNPERSSVEARMEAASIDTHDDKRDEHLRSADFLSAEKYPYIVFKSRRVEPLRDDHYRIVGDLTIRDVTREVALDATFAGTGKNPLGSTVAGFNAEARISREDYGLTWNVGLETGGVLVGDEVTISLEVEALKQG